MYFDTKSYLKSTRNHTAKHVLYDIYNSIYTCSLLLISSLHSSQRGQLN
jgi:Ser-tRNA(Ala) deacylase AlaX